MENEFKKERFNLKVAQRAYKMSMSTDAERYLADIPKQKPKESKNAFFAKKKESLDFSDLTVALE